MPDITAIGSSIRGIGGLPPTVTTTPASTTGEQFGKLLGSALNTVNDLQKSANDAAGAFAAGENIELHDVMIAQEQSSLAFQLTMQVRNKVVEAYQEVMRMSM